jgi:hypothetical protein
MSIVQSARNRIFRLAVEFTASVLTIALADLCASSPVLLRATLSAGQEIRDLSRNSGNVKLRSVRVVLGSSVFSMVIRRVHDRFLPDAINHFIQCQVHAHASLLEKDELHTCNVQPPGGNNHPVFTVPRTMLVNRGKSLGDGGSTERRDALMTVLASQQQSFSVEEERLLTRWF